MSYVNDIKAFLDAYEWADVKGAIKQISLSRYSTRKIDREEFEKIQSEWVEIGPSEKLQEHIEYLYKNGLEWRIVNDKIQARSPVQYNAPEPEFNENTVEKNNSKKTDLSMQLTDKTCMYCDGALVYEPICSGCRLGRLGFKGRYVCMEDMDHEFYVLRDGIILPNQGD